MSRRRRICLLLLLAGLGLAISSVRISPGPGFEFYTGPFFYLLALRWFGLAWALPSAILFMAPSIGWWAHPFSIFTAVAHVLLVHGLRRRNLSLSAATAITSFFVVVPIGVALLKLQYEAGAATTAIVVGRKVLNDMICAATADVVASYVAFDRKLVRFGWTRTLPASERIGSRGLFVAVASFVAMIFTQGQLFTSSMTHKIHDLRARIVLDAEAEMVPGAPRTIVHPKVHDTRLQVEVLRETGSAAPSFDARTLSRCRAKGSIDALFRDPESSTFIFWLESCLTGRYRDAGGTYAYLAPLRPLVHDEYEGFFKQAPVLGLAVLLALLLHTLTRREIANSSRQLVVAISKLGTPKLSVAERVPYSEFQLAIDRFVEVNNDYTAMTERTAEAAALVRSLKSAIGLHLMKEIAFSPECGSIRFLAVSSAAPDTSCELRVSQIDLQSVVEASRRGDTVLEFRVESEDPGDWRLLVVRDSVGPNAWRTGCIFRLRQPSTAQERVAHQARLMELGSMASALSHELKQPLFTIALAAENGMFIADSLPDASQQAIAGKLTRILEQVERAKAIIERTTSYSRAVGDEAEQFDLRDAIDASARFLRPIFVQRAIAFRIEWLTNGALPIRTSRIALEQVLVNALQNGLDAISDKPPAPAGSGRVDEVVIKVARGDEHVVVSVTDSGTGLTEQVERSAFHPFFTTKGASSGTGLGLYLCRQIIAQLGGKLTLANRLEGGAEFRLLLPIRLFAGAQDGATALLVTGAAA